jgi:glucosamine--fructose-6-phosphate aminotransferase (isomerizing)
VLAICNTNGSTIPRESDAVIYTHAGPEIGVASTKGFITQLVASYLLGLYLAQVRGTMFGDEITAVVTELEKMPAHLHLRPPAPRWRRAARCRTSASSSPTA